MRRTDVERKRDERNSHLSKVRFLPFIYSLFSMVMEVDDVAGTSMDTSDSGPIPEPGVNWTFSQVKGNVDGDDTHTDGSFGY